MLVRLLRWVLACGLGMTPLLAVRPAAADASSCVFSMTTIAFGSIDVLPGTAVTSSGILSVHCPTILIVAGGYLNACVTFPTPRQIQGSSAALTYDLYGPVPATATWSNTTPIQFPLTALAGDATASTPVTAAVLAGQATAPVGSYSSSVTATIAYGVLGCSFGPVYSKSATFAVTAIVTSACSVSAQPIAFAAHGLFTTVLDGQGQIAARCTSGAGYTIGLDGGVAGATNPTLRHMQPLAGPGAVTYGLYHDAGRNLPWGSTVNTDTLAGTGNAATQTLPVYARIPVQPAPAPGTYSDTITVTVTY